MGEGGRTRSTSSEEAQTEEEEEEADRVHEGPDYLYSVPEQTPSICISVCETGIMELDNTSGRA